MKANAVLLFFSLGLFCIHAGSQNLIPNPGFEKHKKVPVTFCRTAKEFNATVPGWTMPNEATSDYFTAASKANASTIKNNFAGFQKAEEGDSYTGIYCCMDNATNYSEYLQTKLISPLKAGQRYVIQFYVSLSEASEYAVDRLGVVFTPKKTEQKNLFPIHCSATVESADSIFYDDKIHWRQVRMSFTATGGERYMIIGNFHMGDTHLKNVPVNKKKFYKENGCYYYVDDVCLAPENADGNCFCPVQVIDSTWDKPIVTKKAVKKDSSGGEIVNTEKPVILFNLFFDTDKWEIKPESYSSLDSLADFLQTYTSYYISITGHTDSTGNEPHNLSLSKNRAAAVAQYLISKGVNPDRIRSEGKGSAVPVEENRTPAGRAKNRRVEYTLHE